MRLERLLRPRSVAVIGGGFWGRNVVAELAKIGFDGPVWHVHPRDGFASVGDLPDIPDAAFVGVNRAATVDVVRDLSALGAGGAVCFASGFAEAEGETGDGAGLQAALLAAAADMPILGPNCYGFVNYLDGAALWPDQHGGQRCARGVAIVTQSSNIAINLTMQARGLPVSYVVTVGNQAAVGMSEIAAGLLADDRVTALGLHIEGVDDLRAFEAMAALARAQGVPVIALKVGLSEAAQVAAISHTASLAGSDAGARALLARLGIGQVESLPVFLEGLKLLHAVGPLGADRVASMSCSGGEASLMADLGEGRVTYPPLAAGQKQALAEVLGPRVALANPLDYHTYIWGDVDAVTGMITAMMGGDVAIGLVVLDFPRKDRCDPGAWDHVIDAALRAQAASGKPVALLASLPETMPEAVAEAALAKGLLTLSGLGEALDAVRVAAGIGGAWTKAVAAPVLLPVPGRAQIAPVEAEAKAILAGYSVPVPQSERSGRAGAPEAAARIGFPVVLKGEGFAHKSEAGAVALGLGSAEAVAEAAARMGGDAFLVEEMVAGDVELLIGILRDPAHGFVLTLGAGGVLAELLEDRVSLLLPVTGAEIEDALSRLRLARLLDGYRGAAPVDRAAIVAAVLAVQAYVVAHRPDEIEINPLIAGPSGAVAADALIRGGGHGAD